MSTDTLLTAVEVADVLGVSTQTLAYWRSRREGPRSFKMGPRSVRYRRSDLDAWLQANYTLTAA